jgi:hypothetical protein
MREKKSSIHHVLPRTLRKWISQSVYLQPDQELLTQARIEDVEQTPEGTVFFWARS